MTDFENEVGTRLFDRSPQGVTLTNEGMELLVHAERIEHEAQTILARVGGQEALLSGVVRVAAPEAVGSFLVTPAIGEFRMEHPKIIIELVPGTRQVSLSRHDVDIVITNQQPRRGRMFVSRLAELNLGLYGSKAYLERRGLPQTTADLRGNDFVGLIDDNAQNEDAAALGQFLDQPHWTFRSSSMIFIQNAVSAGIGLGLLHGFAARRDPELVQVLPDLVSPRQTYWTLVHADLRRVPRIRAVIRFLHQIVRAKLGQPRV